MVSDDVLSAGFTRIRSSSVFADKIGAGHVINNVQNKCVNSWAVVFFFEGRRVVDDTAQNVREKRVTAHLGSGGVRQFSQLDNLPSS